MTKHDVMMSTIEKDVKLQQWLAARKDDFETLPNGRVRCKRTGTEFVPRIDVLEAFVNAKKFRKLKEREAALKELKAFEPFFVPSKNFEDKVYCTLTGQLIGMGRFFLQMHVDGKKYRKAKEAFLENRSHLKPEPEITDLIDEIDAKNEEIQTESVPNEEEITLDDNAMDIDDAKPQFHPPKRKIR